MNFYIDFKCLDLTQTPIRLPRICPYCGKDIVREEQRIREFFLKRWSPYVMIYVHKACDAINDGEALEDYVWQELSLAYARIE